MYLDNVGKEVYLGIETVFKRRQSFTI